MDKSGDIPAYSMWKTFNDTIPVILNMDSSENNLKRLTNILRRPEFSEMFLYNPSEASSFEHYDSMNKKYKAFTVWLLGRFFYMLSLEKLSKIHDLIIDAQKRILHKIEMLQGHIFQELTLEYIAVLTQLNDYQKSDYKGHIALRAFVPKNSESLKEILDLSPVFVQITSKQTCLNLLKVTLQFIEPILIENLKNCHANNTTILEDLIYILENNDLHFKFAVLEIYTKVLTIEEDFVPEITRCLMKMFSIYEQLVHHVFQNETKFGFGRFQKICCDILTCNAVEKCKRESICELILTGKVRVGDELFGICERGVGEEFVVRTEDFRYLELMRRQIVREILRYYEGDRSNGVICADVSDTWQFIYGKCWLNCKIYVKEECEAPCRVNETLYRLKTLVELAAGVKVGVKSNVKFFEEGIIFPTMLTYFCNHCFTCKIDFLQFSGILSNLLFAMDCENGELYFQMIGMPFLRKLKYGPDYQFRNSYKDYEGLHWCETRHYLAPLYKEVETESNNHPLETSVRGLDFNEIPNFENLLYAMNLVLLNEANLPCQSWFIKICKYVFTEKLYNLQSMIPNYIATIISNSTNVSEIIDEIVLPLLKSESDEVVLNTSVILPDLITVLSTKHKIFFEYDNTCNISKIKLKVGSGDLEFKEYEKKMEVLDASSKIVKILKAIFALLSKKEDVRRNIVLALPTLSENILLFHQISIPKWMVFLEDSCAEVRQTFANKISEIIKFPQENDNLKQEFKDKMLEMIFTHLKKSMKLSLQSRKDLQETVLNTITNLSSIKHEVITINIMQLLLYFIMIPTSRHSFIAVNGFTELAKKNNMTVQKLYSKHRRELCKVIIELCAINQALVEYTLVKSLERISLMFGFFGPKDFVVEETRYLLPFLVALVTPMPNVKKLINEIASLNDIELSELLSRQYGYIFLHVFLNDGPNESKKALDFVEKSAGLDGSNLRKRNFMIILNELLLNFHEKRERVLLALNHLSKEDPDSAPVSIQDFLQKRFLGVLQYFDFKLIAPHANKRKVLLSLAQLFKYMGPKHISPLRFKIIAMLRTALNLNYGSFPELNCDVWETFIQSCDIETLGPQLATIFVSILPLVRINAEKINKIFQYLVVEHQNVLKDVIPDLFFVLDFDVDDRIHRVISAHLKVVQEKDFKEHLKSFMKYLSYEMIDVRIYALKYIRLLIQKNRTELDEMILGYNGIDEIIVELLDSLTQGCREQDVALRLACGECIGELGAIEPSHLPRRCNQEENSFNFFVNEPTFIIGSLNELLRALQSEKNTQNMDRFALAIQETLKTYGISPEVISENHDLWKLFSEPHQQLMLPLLSSKYTMVQCFDIITVTPIYGSNIGSNYQTWLYNWCISLVSSIKSTQQSLLQVYLVSMKQDHRTLMYFLPYILLHALIEGDPGNKARILNEFKAVLKSQCNTPLSNSTLNVRPVRAHSFASMEQDDIKVLIQNEQYIKVIFVLLDFLDRWLREWLWDKGYSGRDNDNYKNVKTFVSNFCKLQLAKCNFECGEYPRALMYLEDYMLKNKTQSAENLSLLAEIYYRLGEPDGVAGVIAVSQSEPSMEQRILALEVSGKLSDAAACYERLSLPLSLSHIQGLMRCYLDLDNVNTALNMAQGVLERQREYSNWMLEAQAEPLYRLGRYDDLDELLQRSELKDKKTWATQVGSSLLALKKGDRNLFKSTIADIRRSQVNSLGEASLEEGAYHHGYFYISRLHALNELEQVEKVVYELLLRPNDLNVCKNIINQLKTDWELRLKLVQQTVRFIEPILCLRRVAVEQAKNIIRERVPASVVLLDSVLGESWLKSAEIARAAEVHQQAYTYILKAEQYAPPKLFLEKAKLHWIREEHEQAFTTLRRGLSNIIPEGVVITRNSPINNLSLEEKKICAEAKLLIASYNDSISNVDMDMNIQHYKEAMEMFKEWEKSLICLAQYYDRVFQTFSDQERDVKGADIQIYMINYFGKSLQYGTMYIYQSLPRLLSIWFDYGTRLLDETSGIIREERKSNLLKMTKLVDTFLERLPSYIFLTAFSQLVSRICHPQKEVQLELKAIIIKLILKYPQQSLWMIISVIKSSYSVRSKRCSEILSDSRLKTAPMLKFLNDFTKLAERLIELCNKEVNDNVHTVSINAFHRVLPRLITKSDFSEIMIPTQSFRKLVLPNPAVISTQHNPFPNHYVHIVGIDDEMTILQSLQRPRKIVFRGSDGKGYIQMLKPKDDLRKDFRLMEFNHIVNQLLSQEPESRQRRLNIRLYSVAPLNEECGLIEWIPNLVGFRPVLMTLYKQRGLGMKGKELKDVGSKQSDSLETKRNIFLNKLLPKHPPILGDWFKKTFPDVQGWLTARTAYIRTTAVMSMVGYVLGLGDRHGENILLDSTSGDIVHVDFNCLFNKGELFEWPERVPFRLTQNMVAAMGPLGVEGVFRKSSACALRVLRNHTNTLMSIVTPFVYDPLVSWPRNPSKTINANSEKTNESALDNIREIRCRLQGQVRTKSRTYSIPLSVEGQTNYLITEAMNVDNLCQMYIGWGPYL